MPERKLADRIRDAIRLRGYSIRTEKAYLHWYERFVRFHKLRHPATMGAPEVEAFLTHLAVHEQVSASTQNQALSALLFLYQEVLGIPLGNVHALRAKKSTYGARLNSGMWRARPARPEKHLRPALPQP